MAVAGDVEIGWWRSSRIRELQAFVASCWAPGHVLARDERLLRWQHPRGDDEISIVGATSGGSLVGILGVIPVEFDVLGDRRSGGWLTTWYVMPASRRDGVALRLLEFALERHEVVGTVGGNETTLRILRALGFAACPSVPRWVRPVRRDRVARLVDGAAPPAPPVRRGGEAGVGFSPDVAERWDDAWSSRFAPVLVGARRNAAYLRRRYVEHPTFRYRMRVALDPGGAAAALAVARTEEARGGDVRVVRVVEALGEPDALAPLLDGIAADADEDGAAFVDFYCTSARFAPALERAGFVPEEALDVRLPSRFQPLEPTPKPLTAALRLTPAADRRHDALRWDDVYLTRSDCDQDRPS